MGSCGHQEVLEASRDGQSVRGGGPGSLRALFPRLVACASSARWPDTFPCVGSSGAGVGQRWEQCDPDELGSLVRGTAPRKAWFSKARTWPPRQAQARQRVLCRQAPGIRTRPASSPHSTAASHACCARPQAGRLSLFVPRKRQGGGGRAFSALGSVTSDGTGTLPF